MITKNISKIIFKKYMELSPEYIEFNNLKKEITEFIEKIAYDTLSDSEREFLKLYPNRIRFQDDIHLNYLGIFKNIGKVECWFELNPYPLKTEIVVKSGIPLIIKDGYLPDNPLEYIKEKDREKFISLVEKMLEIGNILVEKLKLLENLLLDKELKLKDLKLQYKKLYDLYEQYK